MKFAIIKDTIQRLEHEIYTVYKEGKIPQYGENSYSNICETISILHNEIDPLIEKEDE